MLFSIACPVATRRSWTMRSAMLRYLKKLRRPAMPTANRHTRIATRIICGRFVFINVAPHRTPRVRELARWPRKSCFLPVFVQRHGLAAIPVVNQVFGPSLVHALMCSTIARATSAIPNSRTWAVLDHLRQECPETIQQRKQDVCAALDTTRLIHCGIGTGAERSRTACEAPNSSRLGID